MQQPKFVSLLSTLSKKEIKSFEQYFKKVHGEKKVSLGLLKYLISQYPDFDLNKTHNTYVVAHVKAFKGWDSKRISNEENRLYGFLMEYLVQENLKKKENLIRDQIELEILKERKLKEQFDEKAQSLRKAIRSGQMDLWGYLNLLKIDYAEYYYAATTKITKGKNSQSPDLILNSCAKNLEISSLLFKAKLSYEIKNRSEIFNPELSNFPVELRNLPENLENQELQANTIYKLYRDLEKLVENASNADFFQVKSYFFENHHSFHRLDNYETSTILMNFAIRALRNGDNDFLKELHDLYVLSDKYGFLIESGFIPLERFQNVIVVSCNVGQVKIAEEFLQNNLQYIKENQQEIAKKFAQAHISFAKGNYDEALATIVQMRIDSHSTRYQIKTLEVKALFELRSERFSSLLDAIQSFEIYLHRDENFSKRIVISYQNFLKVTRLLSRPKNKKAKKEIHDFLQNQKEIIAKPWLLEKIEHYDLE